MQLDDPDRDRYQARVYDPIQVTLLSWLDVTHTYPEGDNRQLGGAPTPRSLTVCIQRLITRYAPSFAGYDSDVLDVICVRPPNQQVKEYPSALKLE